MENTTAAAPTLISSIEELLNMDDREYRVVEVPMWKRAVCLRSMTGKERDAFEQSIQKQVGKRTVRDLNNVRARLLAIVWCKAPGDPTRVVTDPKHIAALGEKNAGALDMLFDAACEMNGLKDQDVKDLVGNSAEEDGTSSSSDSPETSDEHEQSS